MSTLKADAVTAKSTNTNIAVTGAGTGKVALGDGALTFPDSDGSANQPIITDGSAGLSFGTLPIAGGGTGAATLTANSALLGNGTSALQAIAPGTSGNVLTSDGSTWASSTPAGGGAWNYIATTTASNAATADFTSQLSSTYDLYMVTGVDIHPHTDEPWFYARFGTATTFLVTAYDWGQMGANPLGNHWSDGEQGSDYIPLTGEDTGGGNFTLGNGADEASAFVFYAANPAGTTYNKVCWWSIAMGNGNNETSWASGAGGYSGTGSSDAYTSLRFYMSTGNISGTFRLYGLANS